MKKTHLYAIEENNTIPRNRAAATELPQAVRDLAGLFAEIAFRRLREAKSAQDIKQGDMK